ncbi:5-formyltetrahydrofolate cyclo-ligase [Holzapfeliella floricola]|uniref:5-formyltetrahydrofolate cyclo-ligase n=1 Tax=Holzapfeliella floricola DSM 23037 = JCM 16512 TaxID=1423744 RepID=A0A0R2DUW1_9LACO|nr:5-formyltetrahydrofolate cyclo-ligase [Holzapfeliella floricola]KRN03876.1 5-formyltetrahydrofolate cyclo-ligase [Holzapfeliella floricola DSM 23037 = JCM 16512]
MDKTELRKVQFKRLQEFSKTTQKQREEISLFHQFTSHPKVKIAETIGLTIGDMFEVDTLPLIEALLEMGKSVYLAKVRPKKQMDFIAYNSGDGLHQSKFGVLEPKKESPVKNQLDLIVVPALAISKTHRYRVGFGGGYFDRFLNQYQSKTVTLALTPMIFEKAEWPVSMMDVPIDELIIPGE